MTEAPPSQPAKIDVDRDRGVTVVFADGRTCFFANEELRRQCPCAGCLGFRERGEPVFPRPGSPAVARVEGAELVGGWGINLRWNDGHAEGIYAFEGLRRWCEAEVGEPEG